MKNISINEAYEIGNIWYRRSFKLKNIWQNKNESAERKEKSFRLWFILFKRINALVKNILESEHNYKLHTFESGTINECWNGEYWNMNTQRLSIPRIQKHDRVLTTNENPKEHCKCERYELIRKRRDKIFKNYPTPPPDRIFSDNKKIIPPIK